jgi:hypothetical protein
VEKLGDKIPKLGDKKISFQKAGNIVKKVFNFMVGYFKL